MVKAIVQAAAIGTPKGPRSGPLVRQLHDFFELRAVTAVSAIALLRLSEGDHGSGITVRNETAAPPKEQQGRQAPSGRPRVLSLLCESRTLLGSS
jgi:hypothetical protein